MTFTGANFQGATTVAIGGVPATNIQVPDSKTITAVVPPHVAGAADIEIVTGAIHFTLPKAYTYSAQAPAPLAPATPTPPAASSTPTSTPAPTTATPTTRKFTVANTDGDSVNLRDKPDGKSGKILTTVPEGTAVQVTGPIINADGATWYPVQVGDKSGFMRADYLSPVGG